MYIHMHNTVIYSNMYLIMFLPKHKYDSKNAQSLAFACRAFEVVTELCI